MSRYPLLGRNEADSFNLRGGKVRAVYTRKKVRVHNKTRTSPNKRNSSSERRPDLAKRKTGVNGSYLISDKMCRLYGGKARVLCKTSLISPGINSLNCKIVTFPTYYKFLERKIFQILSCSRAASPCGTLIQRSFLIQEGLFH